MARTKYGNLTGRAASIELRDQRTEIEEAAAREARLRPLLLEEEDLILRCIEQEGYAPFWTWYESDAVPDYGSTRARIEQIRQHLKDVTPSHPSDALQAVLVDTWSQIPEIPFGN